MFLVIGRFTSYFDPTGLAAARIEVLALSVVIMPALAIDTVCCSYEGLFLADDMMIGRFH